MKTNNHILIAALTATTEMPISGMAACSFEIADTGTSQPWQQILPFGQFQAADGRPSTMDGVTTKHWQTDNQSGAALAALLNTKSGKGLLFDYEHQTLKQANNGQPAPASGWSKKFEWRDNQGLFAQVELTNKAKQHVKESEYQYYSPVILFNKDNGQVTDIHSVALTNDPAIKGMENATALTSNITKPGENNMVINKATEILLKLLGIEVPEDADAAALLALIGENEAKVVELQAKQSDTAALTAQADKDKTQIAQLSAQVASGSGVDLTKFVPIDVHNSLITEHAALSGEHGSLSIDGAIDKAIGEGRLITAADKDYLKQVGQQNGIAALTAMLDQRPIMAALSKDADKQTKNNVDDQEQNKSGVAALTNEQKQMADNLGMSYETYAKGLEG